MRNLEGQVAIVTGAARGIGAATARALAGQGASVILNDVDEQALETTTRALRAAGADADSIVADVTSAPDAERLIERVLRERGRLDALVNNVGGSGTCD